MATNKEINIIICGTGGQGVVLVSELLGTAAVKGNVAVKGSEVLGMAQRGGSVESYVRFGACVLSPLPEEGQVDILVCLYESEYSRLQPELKKGGVDLFAYLSRAHRAVGPKKIFLNTYMLGVVSSFLQIKEKSWEKAMEDTFKTQHLQNKEYFFQGRQEGSRR